MRKLFIVGLVAALASLLAAGAIFAQDTTTTATPWIGVRIQDTDGQVIIARVVSGSPADAADLLIGDVIAAFNGEAVTTAEQLTALVQAAAVGDVATLDILRGGETVSVELTLGSLPAPYGRRGGIMGALDVQTWLAHHLTADLTAVDGGYEVTDLLASRNPFALEVGDVITAYNGVAVADLTFEALHTALAESDSATPTVTVTRGGEAVTLEADTALFPMGRHYEGHGGMGDDFGRGGRGDGGMNPGEGRGDGGMNPGEGRGGGTTAPTATPSGSA